MVGPPEELPVQMLPAAADRQPLPGVCSVSRTHVDTSKPGEPLRLYWQLEGRRGEIAYSNLGTKYECEAGLPKSLLSRTLSPLFGRREFDCHLTNILKKYGGPEGWSLHVPYLWEQIYRSTAAGKVWKREVCSGSRTSQGM